MRLAQARLSGGEMRREEPKRRRRRARPEIVGTDIMTLYGVAEYLHCNPKFVNILLKKGELPGFKLGVGGGTDWRIFRSDVEQWIEQHQVIATPAGHQIKPRRKK